MEWGEASEDFSSMTVDHKLSEVSYLVSNLCNHYSIPFITPILIELNKLLMINCVYKCFIGFSDSDLSTNFLKSIGTYTLSM